MPFLKIYVELARHEVPSTATQLPEGFVVWVSPVASKRLQAKRASS